MIFRVSGRILIPFYFIILLTLCVYTYIDAREFIVYIYHIKQITKDTSMVFLVQLIDMTMIAGLGIMMVKGGYNSFVTKDHGYRDQNITSGQLKVKMSTSIVNIVQVNILEKIVKNEAEWFILSKLAFVYILFLFGSWMLQEIEFRHVESEANYK